MPNTTGKTIVDRERMLEIPTLEKLQSYYDDEYKKLIEICKKLDDLDKNTKQATKNYVVIRLVSIIEQELKMIISNLVDSFDISPKQALQTNDVTIPLDDLAFVKKNDFTIGKFVTSNIGYVTNSSVLTNILSNITNLNFFDWINKLVPSEKRIENELQNYFYLRNDIVHKAKDVDSSADKIILEIKTFQGFCRATHRFISLHLHSDKDLVKEELKKNKLDYSEFEQITNECPLQVQCGDCGNVVSNPKFIPREGTAYYCNKCLPKHKRRPY